MNIFYFDHDPLDCAQQHCDKHVVKMIVEYAQLLSTAHRVIDGKMEVVKKNERNRKVWMLDDYRDGVLYAATHINHPSAKWARASNLHYRWLFSLWVELCREYTHRYGKEHSTYLNLKDVLSANPKGIQITQNFTPPWRAMPDEFKVDKSIEDYCQKSYHAYFNGQKQHIAKWKNRGIPAWFKREMKCE